MRDGGQPDPPVIVVFSAGARPLLREVLAGIEEEGVPYAVDHDDTEGAVASAVDLARRAAQRSPLRVGVGVGACGDVCVQHDKLDEVVAELCSGAAADLDVARILGHNAARIVVGLPLRPLRADQL